jgi:hypothetical protein
MWDPKLGPELISIDALNHGAEKLKAKTKHFRQLRHEIQNFYAVRAPKKTRGGPPRS